MALVLRGWRGPMVLRGLRALRGVKVTRALLVLRLEPLVGTSPVHTLARQ